MNEQFQELVNEMPKIGEDIISARPDVSEETAVTAFDLIAKEKDMAAMAGVYDTQSKESIDCSVPNDELDGLPIHQMLDFEDILASVQNDFASIIEMQKETSNEVSNTDSNE